MCALTPVFIHKAERKAYRKKRDLPEVSQDVRPDQS